MADNVEQKRLPIFGRRYFTTLIRNEAKFSGQGLQDSNPFIFCRRNPDVDAAIESPRSQQSRIYEVGPT